MSGLAVWNSSISALLRSTIGGCVCVQNRIVVLSCAAALRPPRVAAPTTSGVAASPCANLRRLIFADPIFFVVSSILDIVCSLLVHNIHRRSRLIELRHLAINDAHSRQAPTPLSLLS